MTTNSANNGKGRNAIGGDELPWWRVSGEMAGSYEIRRYRAENSDEAKAHAHAHGMTVETCEPMQTRK